MYRIICYLLSGFALLTLWGCTSHAPTVPNPAANSLKLPSTPPLPPAATTPVLQANSTATNTSQRPAANLATSEVSLLQANPVNDPLLVIPAIYDDVHPFSDGVAEVQRDGKWETIDRNGQRVTARKPKSQQKKSDGMVTPPQKSRIKTGRNDDVIFYVQGDLKYFNRHGKIGIKDQQGRIVVPPIYGHIGNFSEGMAPVADVDSHEIWGPEGDGKWGFINQQGKLVIPLKYFAVGEFHHGLAPVVLDHGRIYHRMVVVGHWAPIDKKGRLVIGTQYDGFQYLTRSLLAVCSGALKDKSGYLKAEYAPGHEYVGGKWGVIDYHTNKLVMPIKYDRMNRLSDKLLAVNIGENYIPSDNWDPVPAYRGTLIDPGKWGVIDYHGKTILPLIYAGTRELSQGMLAVKLNGKWGFVRLK